MSVMSVPLDTKTVFSIDDAPSAISQLERAFGRGADALYRFILVRVARRRDVADDLLQQTCCIAVQQNRVFADDDECESWMRGIARNLVKAHWRSVKKHNGRINLEDAEQSRQLLARLESQTWGDDELADEESIARLMYAITALPSAEQRLIFDFYFDGRSQEDLARELDVSSKAIESRLYRLRGRLRAILDNTERTNES